MEKIKNRIIVCIFAIILLGGAVLHFALPDRDMSVAERRKLTQTPEISADRVFSGGFTDDFESYLLDQFPMRETFRTVKSVVKYDVFRQQDNNGVYFSGDHIGKIDSTLNENQVLYAAKKITDVYDTYLTDSKVAVTVIPDKGYFLAESGGYPHYNYEKMFSLVTENIPDSIEYIDIRDLLDISDYYFTDAHWRQDCIVPVAERITGFFGVPFDDDFETVTLSPFNGVYVGQSAYPVEPDSITYLTNSAISSAVVTGRELDGENPVYCDELIDSDDGYDVFLYGPQSLLTIENKNAATDRELIVFRDSFGSSLSPLFIGSYSSVTLVDLRYLGSMLLGDNIDFHGQDVLFVYNTSLLNTGMLLK